MKKIKLKNGINLFYNEDNKYNSTLLQVDFILPTNTKNNVKLALICKILGRSSDKFLNIQEINVFLNDNYGASFNLNYEIFGNYTILSFSVKFIHPKIINDSEYKLSNFVEFLQEIIFDHHNFSKVVFESEKNNLIKDLKDSLTDPKELIFSKTLPLYISSPYFNDPYDGTILQIKNISFEEFKHFWCEILNTSPINIYYDGKKTDNIEILFTYFRNLNSRDPLKLHYAYHEQNLVKPMEIIKNCKFEQNIFFNQYYLNLSYRSKDYAKWLVLNQILGGDSQSLLFRKIREELNLSYEIFSFINCGLNTFYIYATLNEPDFQKADLGVKQVFEDIELINYSTNFLEQIKSTLINQLLLAEDDREFYVEQQEMREIIPNFISNQTLIDEIKIVKGKDLLLPIGKIIEGIKMRYVSRPNR